MDVDFHETDNAATEGLRKFQGSQMSPASSLEDETASIDPVPAYESFGQRLEIEQGGSNITSSVSCICSSIDILNQLVYKLTLRTDDGRVDIDIRASSHRFSKLFAADLHKQSNPEHDQPPAFSQGSSKPTGTPTPRLNIVIQVVGSRGDVQPFVSLGLTLQKFGHRVRLATHPIFKQFVEGLGLEFYSIGGDPTELMAYMVKNPGLMPKLNTLRDGEVQRRRRAMRDIMRRCWRSCFEAGDGCGADGSGPQGMTGKMSTRSRDPRPFVADAIIANPPSFAHIHCAEKLGIPIHLMFTYVPVPLDH